MISLMYVTGGHRLPDFNDRTSIPYVDLIIAELLRWRPTAPLGVHHQSQQPDIYKGYYFPSGTTFIPNIWGVFHDEKIFSEPERFRPERFLKENAGFDTYTMGAFGYGRRVCPGRYLADSSMWLALAQILSAFIIQPKRDGQGQEVLPSLDYKGGLVM
ncbi:hypothetical protein NP233_g2007 [Leucocoprinus birnbaumii]|uniref:Cytochrome P450 n=1 Tax=Leucocoprinus birnbaumii TaxID=56174 RepID=A0AAD5VZL8_9AGAR|nr:hypothetical protein NP233_g2007 [Leucocoprinus birnbaumii]